MYAVGSTPDSEPADSADLRTQILTSASHSSVSHTTSCHTTAMSFTLDELAAIPTDLPPCAAPTPNPLPSFWSSSWDCPLANAGSTGDLPKTADVVIIGSGFTGTCAAAKLVDELLAGERVRGGGKTRVVVLEAREFCSGATGKCTGMNSPGPTYR